MVPNAYPETLVKLTADEINPLWTPLSYGYEMDRALEKMA